MASGPHTFTILGVFSAEQFQGNRLAVVAVRGNALTPSKKSLIAKEFGYTGTVFIHDAPNPSMPRRIEIYTEKGEELSFSGHCVLGTAHYVFQCCEPSASTDRDKPLTTLLMTKAGPVPVLYNTQRQVAACSIPHAYHLHGKKVEFEKVLNVQPQIQIVPTINNCKGKTFPVVSIVKGMTFALIDLTEAPDVLGALEAGKAPEVELDEEWSPSYVGAMYYKEKQTLTQAGEPTIHSIQARVITNGTEDPGTGSACSALACYLAMAEDNNTNQQTGLEKSPEDQVTDKTAQMNLGEKQKAVQRHVYAIQQGVEMGRNCTIAVEVDVGLEADGSKRIKNVTISGRASFFAKGDLSKPS